MEFLCAVINSLSDDNEAMIPFQVVISKTGWGFFFVLFCFLCLPKKHEVHL